MKNVALVLCSQLICPIGLFSEEPAPAPTSDPVIVRATRLPAPWRKAPQSITRISRAQIEAQDSKPLGEILEGESGAAYLVKGNGFSAAKSGVQMRSFAMGSEIVVARDGRRLSNDSDGEGFDLSLIDVGSLETVELLRGASSSLFGSGAHAGVIHLVTRRPGSEPETVLRLLGGSAGFEHLCFETEQRHGPWGLRLSAQQQGAGDYWTADHSTFSNTAQHRVGASLALDRDLGNGSGLRLGAQFMRGSDNGLPGDLNAPAPDDRDRSDDRGYASAEWRSRFDSLGDLRLLYDYGVKARETERLGARSAARTKVTQSQLSRAHGALLAMDSPLGSQRLLSGLEARREDHEGSGWIQPATGAGFSAPKLPRSSVEIIAGYLQDEWDLNPSLRLSAGLRNDYTQVKLYDDPALLYTPTERDSQAFTGHAGASFEFIDGFSVKTSGGNSYVSPNTVQLYTFDPRTGFALLGNPRLDPETGWSADMGVAVEGGWGKAELTGYHSEMQGRLELAVLLRDFAAGGTRFKDLNGAYSRPDLLADPKLVNAPTNKWFYHRNLGQVQVQGIEAMLEAALYKDWALVASANIITRMVEVSSGRWLDSAPPVSGRLALEKRTAPFEVYLSGRYGAGYGTVSRTRAGLPLVFKEPYFIVDLSLRYEFVESLTAIVSGKNLFNQAWQQTLDVPEAGLEGRAGIELKL